MCFLPLPLFVVVSYRATYLNANGCNGPPLALNITSVTTCTPRDTCLGTTEIACPTPGSVLGYQLNPTAKPTVAAGSPTMAPTVAALTVLKATQVVFFYDHSKSIYPVELIRYH